MRPEPALGKQAEPWTASESHGLSSRVDAAFTLLIVEKLNISDNSDTENPTVNTVSGAQRLSHMKDGVALPKVK